jgi:hypothetical protein
MPAPRLQTHASPTPSAPDVVDTAATRSDVVEPLNLTPLLKAYDEALKLARHPPASLRLSATPRGCASCAAPGRRL